MGMRIITRNHEGKVQAAYCATQEFITDPAIAEALGARKTVEMRHRQLGWRKIIREGDALTLVKILQSEGAGWVIMEYENHA
jgi:hypothetical protein